MVVHQEVPSVEIHVSSFEHAPEQLLLRLDFVPGVTQELVHSSQRSHQDPCLPFGWRQGVHSARIYFHVVKGRVIHLPVGARVHLPEGVRTGSYV